METTIKSRDVCKRKRKCVCLGGGAGRDGKLGICACCRLKQSKPAEPAKGASKMQLG